MKLTDNLRVALVADPLEVRCACGRVATLWCQPCDTAACHPCNPTGFHVKCRALLRTIGALRIAHQEREATL